MQGHLFKGRTLILSAPEKLTWSLGQSEDRAWRAAQFSKLPGHFAAAAAAEYVNQWHKKGAYCANSALRETVETVGGFRFDVAGGEDDLRAFADSRAAECYRVINRALDADFALELMQKIAVRVGVVPPDAKQYTKRGQRARLICPLWWRRALRRTVARSVEHAAIKLGLVQRLKGIYASDETVARREQQKAKNERLLSEVVLVNELNQEFSLEKIASLGMSNPEIRRKELMTRIAGFEAIANGLDHVGMLYTLTCPSSFHAVKANGQKNPKYNDSTPKQAQSYLCGLWAKVRAALAREGVRLYGVRVAEAHHDGTPHWHILVFMDKAIKRLVTKTLRHYAFLMDGKEAGAFKNRFDAKEIDRARGSAAGYIAKYIAKNIDGHKVGADFEAVQGVDTASTAKRVEAWASCWGIRQFQQLGGPPVGVWRELRRLDFGGDSIIDHAAAAADCGNWAQFITLMGGIDAKRADMTVSLWKDQTGELGRYGEIKAESVEGIQANGEQRKTRVHSWTVKRNPKKPDTANICEGFDVEGADFERPRSSVNNCTEIEDFFPVQSETPIFPPLEVYEELRIQEIEPEELDDLKRCAVEQQYCDRGKAFINQIRGRSGQNTGAN